MYLISYLEMLSTCYGFIDESLRSAHAESQTFIFNPGIYQQADISIFELNEKVPCYKLLWEHSVQIVFVFSRSGFCLSL